MTDRIEVANKGLVFDSKTGLDKASVWVNLYHDDVFCRTLNHSEWDIEGLVSTILDRPQEVVVRYAGPNQTLTCRTNITLRSSGTTPSNPPRSGGDTYTPTSMDRTETSVNVIGPDGGIFCCGGADILAVGQDVKKTAGWKVYYVEKQGASPIEVESQNWSVMTDSPSIPCVCGVEILARINDKPFQCRRIMTFSNISGDQKIRIFPSDLPVAYVGAEYSARLEIEASEDYSTSVSGKLPQGLSVEKNVIRGIPGEIGEFSFSITATLAGGPSDSANFSMSVKSLIPGEAPRILGRILASGMVGQYYEKTIEYTGSEPISWSATGLPAGLHIDNSGAVSGVPTAAFSGMFHVTARNAYGTAESDISLTIAQSGDAPHILTPSLPEGVMYASYRAEQRVEGMEPISWTASGLPGGLQIFPATGAILGVPTQLGTFNVSIRAENAIGSDSVVLPLVVRPSSAGAPRITTATMPGATVGVQYSCALAASGTSPISWYATSLPNGLSISRDTGLISGTPSAAGEYTVTVTARNAYGEDTKTFGLVVSGGGEGLVLVPHKTEYAYGEPIGPADLEVFYAGKKLQWHEFRLLYDRFVPGRQRVVVGYNRDQFKLEPIITGTYEVVYAEESSSRR